MAREKPLSALKRELGAAPPGGLEALPEKALEQLAQDLAAAKRHQSEALLRAIDEGMKFVPALLRIALKKILFP